MYIYIINGHQYSDKEVYKYNPTIEFINKKIVESKQKEIYKLPIDYAFYYKELKENNVYYFGNYPDDVLASSDTFFNQYCIDIFIDSGYKLDIEKRNIMNGWNVSDETYLKCTNIYL